MKELHRDFVNNIVVSDEDFSVSDYIKSVKEKDENGIFDFSEISEKLIVKKIY